MNRSWAPEVFVDKQWAGNGLRFATKEEAEYSGRALLMRWFSTTDSRAVEADEYPNYRIDLGTGTQTELCSEGGCGLDKAPGSKHRLCSGHQRMSGGGHSPQGIAYND